MKKILIGCCIIKGYYLYQKLFKQSLLANITTTYWQNTLILIKPKSLSAKNTIDQTSKRMLKFISKNATFVYCLN